MSDKSNKCEHHYDGLCMCNPILNDCGVLLGYEECNKISHSCIKLTGQLLQAKRVELRNKHDKEKLDSEFQQFKAENEELKEKLEQAEEDIKQYSDWLDEAREDVEKAKKYNYDAGQRLIRMSQELQQLKAENEKLKEKYAKLEYNYYEATQPNDYATRKSKRADRILKCLDEIEEICKTTICDYSMNKVEEIMKLIKQAKEGNNGN